MAQAKVPRACSGEWSACVAHTECPRQETENFVALSFLSFRKKSSKLEQKFTKSFFPYWQVLSNNIH